MTDTNPAAGRLPEASKKSTPDDGRDWTPDPKTRFGSPEMLVEDAGLSDAEKLALLQEWSLEIDNRLKAEEEGMSASDPISGRKEARLADEAARVSACITAMAKRIGTSD